MAQNGKIKEEDIVDKKVYDIGQKFSDSLTPANTAIDKFEKQWIDAINKIKQSALAYNEVSKQFGNVKTNTDFVKAKQKELGVTEQITIAYKEQSSAELNLLKTQERKKIATESTNRALIKEREELRQTNLEVKRSLTAMGQLTSKRDQARKTVQEYQAQLRLGKKLSDQEQAELKQSVREFQKYDKAVKGVKTSTNQFQENVGNYPKQFGIAANAFRQLLPAVGIMEGFRLALDFSREALALAREAKGVNFAFQEIEDRTLDAEEALLRVKKSTRGLLSDLDIKRAIVELDNFNISTKETDTLMEFLAVRAAQTGRSIDSLKDSLVEGLSKESKLRIDNLGISAAELNEELEKTPDFVEAVANIARKEIKEAGGILDDAANSQEKFNAAFEDFKVSAGSGFIGRLTNDMYALGTSMISTISDVNDASKGFGDYILNLFRSIDPNQNAFVKAEAAIQRELKKRPPLVQKIIELQRELGIEEDVLAQNKKSLIELNSVQLRDMLKSQKALITQTEDTKTLTEEEKKLAEERRKALEARLKLLAQDKRNSSIAFLQSEIEAEKNAADNEEKTYSDRIAANQQFFNAKKQLLETEKAYEIEENKDRLDKIAQIELDYDDDIIAAKEEKQKRDLAILKSYFQQEIQVVQEAQKAKDAALNAEIGGAQTSFASSAQTPADVEAYEKQVSDIRKKYALQTVQVQIDAIKKLQQDRTFSAQQQAQLAEQLALLEIEYSNIVTDQAIDDIDREQEALEGLAEFKRALFANLSQGLGDALGISTSGINDIMTGVDNGLKRVKEINATLEEASLSSQERFQLVNEKIALGLSVMSSAAEVTRDIIGSVYQSNIEELENQRDAMNEYYDQQYERAEGDQVQQDLIREEQRAKEVALNKEVAKEKTKAAQADKTAAIIQAGINTALAVTSALTQAPPASFVLAALSAALGLAQVAIIASKPIPKFKDGHLSGTHEGWALTNDGGRDEVWERNGEAKVIKGRNVPIKMKKGDKIHKSVEDYDRMYRASMLASVEINNKRFSDYEAERAYYSNERALREEMALTRHAIAKNKTKVLVNQTKPVDISHELYRLRSLE